jgi:hypothetical protein
VSEKTTFLDALWWAIVTATTVGHGASFPDIMQGKITTILYNAHYGVADYPCDHRADGIWTPRQ